MADENTPTGDPQTKKPEAKNTPPVEPGPDGLYPDGSKDGLTEEEKQGGEFVPRTRLNEQTQKLKELELVVEKMRLAEEERTSAAQKATTAKLQEDQNYKALWELSEQKRVEAESNEQEAHKASLRLKVGQKLKLDPELATRLQGETEAEMELDGLKLQQLTPKVTSVADGNAGTRRPISAGTSVPSEESLLEKKRNSSPMYRDVL